MPVSQSTAISARPSFLYRVATVAVAVTMAILPVVYVALTALAGWGVYLFATRHFVAIWRWPIGGQAGLLIKTFCSFTPLLTGGVAAFFMVKPLFARRPRRMQPLALTAENEPRVHSLVHEVCRIVGAPAPRRIELSCDLNASAHFDGGLRGVFTNRLILTLGLPLVAGLTQRELAGVIAHEFGHFRQGGGMRVSYLVRRLSGWFARVIYERDSWDALIAGWAAEARGSSYWAVMVACIHFGVGFSRGVLWLLMNVGRLVGSALQRQMEYDADRCEIVLAGSTAFESTAVKFAVLGGVVKDIHFNMRRSWRSHFQVPDNLPLLVEYRVQRIPAERRLKLENESGLGKTGLLDTHPCTADRVRRARRIGAAGYEVSDEPARALFENFDGLSRLVTLAHYEDDLLIPAKPEFLIPLEELVQAEMAKAAGKAAGTASEDSPAPKRPRAAVPMMAYDQDQFRGKGRK